MIVDEIGPNTLVPDAVATPPFMAFGQLLFGKHITYSLSAVARLGIADSMGKSPMTVEELALHGGAQPDALYRVMRALAAVGVFDEFPGRRFALTPVGELLKTDAPDSLRYLAMEFCDQWTTRAFEHFTDCVRTGNDGMMLAWGKNAFEFFVEHPDQGETFHHAMTNFSAIAGAAVLEAYDFSGVRCIADIGGGHGKLLAAVLKQYPSISGVLYDLPEVTKGAFEQSFFAECEDRIRVENGNFFEGVPAGCDAYLMKHILHDWSDDYCRTLLRHIRKQLPAGGRVLVCELVVPDSPEPHLSKMLDIEMLIVTPGGKERTAEEFRELFASVDLKLERIVPTTSPICVLEARPSGPE